MITPRALVRLFFTIWRRRRHIRRRKYIYWFAGIITIYLVYMLLFCLPYLDWALEEPPVFEKAFASKSRLVLPRSDNGSSMDPQKHKLPSRLPNTWGFVNLAEGPIPANSIHFVITSLPPTKMLKPRELCAIESAALYHSDRIVIVSVRSPSIFVDSMLHRVGSAYPNIAFLSFNTEERLKGTPLEDWYNKASAGGFEKSSFAVGWLSDLMRASTLYKYGGWYLDTDQITLNRFTNLRNTIASDYAEYRPNGNFIAFDKGHQVLWDNMEAVVESIKPKHWNTSATLGIMAAERWAKMGPKVWEKAIIGKGWCKMKGWCWPMQRVDVKSCDKGVSVLRSPAFAPIVIPLLKWYLFSASAGRLRDLLKNSYGVHLYNYMLKDYRILLRPEYAVTDLFQKSCPVTTKMAGSEM